MIQSFTIHAFVTGPPRLVSAPSTLSLGMAGFGGAPSSKKNKELKIKPKAQWDRYTDMKKVPMVRVGVRKTDTDDWLEVGRVRAKDTVTTEIAVARQRALIADVSKCVFVSRIITRTVRSSYPRLFSFCIARTSAVSSPSFGKGQDSVGILGRQ